MMNGGRPFWPVYAIVLLVGVLHLLNPAPAHAAERNDNVLLVMDTSGSMDAKEIASAVVAARNFADTVPDTVPVGLIDFDDQARVLVRPTTDRVALDNGLTKLKSGGGTALYAAVVEAVKAVGHDGSVVILSDGVDSAKTTTLAQAKQSAKAANVSLDAVAFTTTGIPAGLSELVSGKVVTAQNSKELANAFKQTALLATAADAKAQTDAATVTVAKPVLPLWVAVVLVALFMALTGFLLFSRSKKEAKRKREVTDALTAAIGPSYSPQDTLEAPEGVLGLSQRYVAAKGREERIALSLDRAGLAMKPNEWVVIRFCAVMVGAALIAVLTKNILASVVLGVVVGLMATKLWLNRRQNKRSAAFADQLPDTLQIVASSLRSGFSLNQSLAAAHERGLEPMASELGRAMAAARIGANLEDELEAVGVRMRSEDWKWAVMAIRIQRNVGGNLADVLLTTAKTLRERMAMTRHVRALSAEGRLSAYILIALPLFIASFLFLTRRTYIQPLWTTSPGLIMLAVAVTGIVIGWFWMRKVIEVEV